MEPNSAPTSNPANGEAPKKFIRTFASDMETFQKGGIPDLAPFKKREPAQEQSTEKEPLPDDAKSIPLEAVPLPSQVIVPVPKPKFEQQPFVPVPEPVPVVVPKPVVEEPQPAPLETYSSDFKDRVKEMHASTATVLAAEQDAGSTVSNTEERPLRDGRNALYITAGLTLFLIGSIGVVFAYSHYLGAGAPVIIAPSARTPIFVDSREEVSGLSKALQQAIKESIDKPLAINTVRLLTLATSTSTGVFGALSTRIPGILVRNIDPSESMAGVVNVSSPSTGLGAGGASAFFILSVEAYSATFSGMLEWEPLMQSDLATIFPLYPALATATSSTGSTGSLQAATTAATTTSPKLGSRTVAPKSSFHDEVVSNHDVRIYRDAENRSIMLYGYWDEGTLVIARDPVAFAEILARLATSHTK